MDLHTLWTPLRVETLPEWGARRLPPGPSVLAERPGAPATSPTPGIQ